MADSWEDQDDASPMPAPPPARKDLQFQSHGVGQSELSTPPAREDAVLVR